MLNFLQEKYLEALKVCLLWKAEMQLACGMGIFLLSALLLHGSGMLKVSRSWVFLLRKCGVTYIT